MERLATILLPKPVAAHDIGRHVMDGSAKIFKENKTVQNRPSLAEMAVTEFRVRCFGPDEVLTAHCMIAVPREIARAWLLAFSRSMILTAAAPGSDLPGNKVESCH
jgi:hypothetical protein